MEAAFANSTMVKNDLTSQESEAQKQPPPLSPPFVQTPTSFSSKGCECSLFSNRLPVSPYNLGPLKNIPLQGGRKGETRPGWVGLTDRALATQPAAC